MEGKVCSRCRRKMAAIWKDNVRGVMVWGPSPSSFHTFSLSLCSSSSEIVPIWVSCAPLFYGPLWSQRKHLHIKALEIGRVFVGKIDNCKYSTKMLNWGKSSFLQFLSVSFRGKDDPFRHQDHNVKGKAEVPHAGLAGSSWSLLLSCIRLQNLVTGKNAPSGLLSLVFCWGKLLPSKNLGMGYWGRVIRSEGCSRFKLLFAEEMCS